jgi:hypothetical protein
MRRSRPTPKFHIATENPEFCGADVVLNDQTNLIHVRIKDNWLCVPTANMEFCEIESVVDKNGTSWKKDADVNVDELPSALKKHMKKVRKKKVA